MTMLFSIFVCSVYRLVLHRGEKLRVVFGRIPRLVLSLVLAVAVLAGGLVYGVKKFQLSMFIMLMFPIPAISKIIM